VAIYTSGLICQLAIQSTDGVMSAIQIVDRIIVDLPEDVPLGNMVIQPVPCWAILVFKSEDPEEFNVGFRWHTIESINILRETTWRRRRISDEAWH